MEIDSGDNPVLDWLLGLVRHLEEEPNRKKKIGKKDAFFKADIFCLFFFSTASNFLSVMCFLECKPEVFLICLFKRCQCYYYYLQTKQIIAKGRISYRAPFIPGVVFVDYKS